MEQRLFSGVYPAGIVYADRFVEEGGDYKRLGFLSYSTLQLEVREGCPPELKAEIEASAAKIQARSGELFQISSCDQFVRLGSQLQ